MPLIRPGFKSSHGGDVSFWRAVFKVVIEKRPQYFTSKRERRVAVELDRAERAALANLLTVMPWSKHEIHLVVVRILRFDRLVYRDVAVDVFLVPKTVYQHHRNFEWLPGENLIDGLIAPVSVVIRMLEDLAPEADLVESATAAEFACRTSFHKHVVVVEVAGPPFDLVAARCLLVVDITHALLAERAIVKPIVTDPAIDHRIHRH